MRSEQTTTGGDVVAHQLRLRGINSVFCLAGAAHAHTLYALERHGLFIISSRHETSTVSQADGYARVSGKPGVAMVAGYQGLPNVLAGVRTAQLACSPVVILASVAPPAAQEALGEESSDPLDIVKPFVKWARTVPTAERLGEFLSAALHQAVTGRPGVAVLGVTQRQQAAELPSAVPYASTAATQASKVAPAQSAIEQAASAVLHAQRPMLLVGSGAALADAGPALQRFANALGIPVLGHALGRGLVPEDMRLGFPWALAQPAAREADVVIAAGIRLTQRIGYGMAPRFAQDATFIQIDISAEEIGRNRPIHVPIVGDAATAVAKLQQQLDSHGNAVKRWTPDWVHESISPRLARLQQLADLPSPPLHPVHIGRELAQVMPADSIFVADGADIYNWMSGTVPIRAARCYLDHYPLGSMGVGLPWPSGLRPQSVRPASRMAARISPWCW